MKGGLVSGLKKGLNIGFKSKSSSNYDWITYPEQTSNFAALPNVRYPVNTNSNSVVVTLPIKGKVWIYNSSCTSLSGGFAANKCSIVANNQQTIGSAYTGIDLTTAYGSIILESNNNNWEIIGGLY